MLMSIIININTNRGDKGANEGAYRSYVTE